MLPDPLSIIWRCADVPDPELTADEICCLAPSTFDCLVSLGLLKQTTTARHVTCLDCTEQHVEEVLSIKDPDGCTRFFIRCPENGRVEVSRDRLLQYAVDYTPLQQVVSAAHAAGSTAEEVVPGRLWNLGRAALGGKSRTLWMARGLSWPDSNQLKEILPRGRLPVLFYIGQPPAADLVDIPQQSIIDIKTVVYIENNELMIDKDAIEYQLQRDAVMLPEKKKQPKKRAHRATTIDAVKKALKEHTRAARDHAHHTLDKTGEAVLLPRPTQTQLAKQIKVHVSSISRAINDNSDKGDTDTCQTKLSH